MTRPIVDPHAGQLALVVSFRVNGPLQPFAEANLRGILGRWSGQFADGQASRVDISIRQIGAAGEAGEDEGRHDGPSAPLEPPQGGS